MKWYTRFLIDLIIAAIVLGSIAVIPRISVPVPERIVERTVERCSAPAPCVDSVTRFDLRVGGEDSLRCPVGATSHVTVPSGGDGYHIAFECHCVTSHSSGDQ